MSHRIYRGLILAALVFQVVQTASADLFTSEAAFTTALGGNPYYLEDFNAYNSNSGNIVGPSLSLGPVNGFSFTATASTNVLYAVNPGGNGALSTGIDAATLRITFTGLGVNAVGGNFFATDDPGNITNGTTTFTLVDGSSITIDSTSVVNGTNDNSTFRGFTSSVAIARVDISTGGGGGLGPYPTVDHLYISAVPEPSAALFGGLICGLAAVAYGGKKFLPNGLPWRKKAQA